MIVGIVGSRRRNTEKDWAKVIVELGQLEIRTQKLIKKIVTGDCDEGGDKFAREISDLFGYELEVKYKLDPETGEKAKKPFNRCAKQLPYDYWTFVRICYARNEEIAKEPLDYLLALVAPDRKGGTENTIKHFKRLHKDWEEKLIIL